MNDQSPIDYRLSAPIDDIPEEPDEDLTSSQKLVQSRFAVLSAIFLALGAFGIPLLWMNKNFGVVERVVWSMVATAYTGLMLGILVWVLWKAYEMLFTV